jgi:hypothetical protein
MSTPTQNGAGTFLRSYYSSPGVSSGTTDIVVHYYARQGNFTGTVTEQKGFAVDGNLSGAVTNYGFHSNLKAIDGSQYNFYAEGAAPSYFAGDIQSAFYIKNKSGVLVQDLSSYDSNAGWAANPPQSDKVGIAIRNGGQFLANLGTNTSVFSNIRRDNDGKFLSFSGNNNVEIGNLRMSGGAIAGPATSDYRVKNSVTSLTNASAIINQLNPVSFEYTYATGYTHTGFIAHELQEHFAEGVFGTKDATEAIGTLADYDGTELETAVVQPSAEELEYSEEVETNGVATMVTRTRTWTPTGTQPVYQGVDQTKLIPLLTKALQEALTEIDNLKSRITTLESN